MREYHGKHTETAKNDDKKIAPSLRLQQFTPFFPTSIPAAPSPAAILRVDVPGPLSTTTVSLLTPEQVGAGEAGENAGENFGPLLNYTIWLMTGVSFTVLMLRVYCKMSRDRRLWWDDWVLKLSWVCLHPL